METFFQPEPVGWDSMTPNAGEPIKSIETTFRIIEVLKGVDTAGVTDLAAELDLPKSTVYSHVRTLRDLEYIHKVGEEYQIGCRFLELGERARDRTVIYDHAKQPVDRLAEETGEISGLLIEEHGMGSLIYRSEGERSVKIDTFIGIRFHLHTAALGKAILAHLPAARREEILDERGLPERTPSTITDREVLAEELADIRAEKIAYSDEERTPGIRSVAAPIMSSDGEILGAISIAGPTSRLRGDRFETEYPELLRDAANVIELEITYS
jgi:DNA-binding IclR family transcriptional regulator